MKKKIVRRSHRKVSAGRNRRAPAKKSFFLLLKSWMFVVMFALMLGVGAIVGAYISQQINTENPQVAGVSIEAE